MKNVKKIICVLIVSAIMATGTVVKACPASSQKAIEETYLKAQKRSALIYFRVDGNKPRFIIKVKANHFIIYMRRNKLCLY